MKHNYWKGFGSGIVVAAIGIVTLGGLVGFQATSTKIGVVDNRKVVGSSEIYRKSRETLNNATSIRQSILEFIIANRTMKKEDAQRFRDLTLKNLPTEVEKSELEKIKAGALDGEKRKRELELKNPPSADETKALEEFRNRQAGTGDLLQEWQKEFQQELEQLDAKIGQDLEKTVKDAIQEVGKKQGYSVVYASTVAPYAANDITDEVLKAVNKAK